MAMFVTHFRPQRPMNMFSTEHFQVNAGSKRRARRTIPIAPTADPPDR